jgi:RimJ/RimL family protein N-acetyltransferase
MDDAVVGGIGIDVGTDVFRRSAEIGYWLGEPFWGRGIATEVLRALTDYAWATFDIIRLEAGVFSWNPASARVLEKAGYTLEGCLRQGVVKQGRVGDRLIYGLLRP